MPRKSAFEMLKGVIVQMFIKDGNPFLKIAWRTASI
jgi:hypothetical protein